jgi:hypothetical protein
VPEVCSTTHAAGTGQEGGVTADPNTPLRGIPPATLPPTTLQVREEEDPYYSGISLWLHRITVLLFVFLCASVGVLLVIMPWRPEWTDNHLLLAYPSLRDIVSSGFVRGVCSGLGILDIWIGFWEAVHYHEGKRS